MRRLALWLVLGNLAIAVALGMASFLSLQSSREADEEAARLTAMNLASSLGIEVGAELRLIDNALATVAFRFLEGGSADDAGTALAQGAVDEQRRLLPHVAALRVADAQGRVRAGLGPGEPSLNVGDRPYFAQARKSEGMVMSQPMRSQVTNDWSLILARRLLTKEGTFHGVVYAVIHARHFTERFARLDLGASGAVALRTGELRLVARYANNEPYSEVGMGEVTVSRELIRQLEGNAEQGWYLTLAVLDNVERIGAYSRVRGYPLLMLTGLATEEFLASWRREVLLQASLVGFIVLVTAGFSAYLYWRQLHERRERVQAVKTAREQRLMLENDLVGMVRVRGQEQVWANKAAHRIFGYEVGKLQGQPTRLLYLDDESHARVNKASDMKLRADGRFHAQLRMRRQDGQPIWIDLSGASVSEDESLWMMVDIDALKRRERHARRLALRDPLTGLVNRRLLDVRLEQALASAQTLGVPVALCYVDLDGFKQINDVHGHGVGDVVLRAVAQRLREAVRAGDSVARLGGDEFAVLLGAVAGMPAAMAIMRRCLASIQAPVVLESGEAVRVDASVGIVLGHGGASPQTLLKLADEAMYAAKRAGKGRMEAVDARPGRQSAGIALSDP